MPFLTNADIEQRKAAGIKMNKLNCGWNLPPEITAIIAERLSKFEPKTKAEEIELHHIIPLAFGGTDDYFNLIYLCHDCHMKLHHTIYDNLQFKISDLQINPNHGIIE